MLFSLNFECDKSEIVKGKSYAVIYKKMEINYIIQKEKRRSMSLTVGADKKVIVKVPVGTADEFAIAFMREKKKWILKQISKIEMQTKLADEMGRLSEDDLKQIKKKAKIIIPQRVVHYASLSGITYNKIFIRLQKTRWGSCSRDGNLNFNCLLVLMPMEILDSVVVHELCHRKHMNHSKSFYDEVLKIFPEYKRCDKWLKQNGGAYFKRFGK